MRKQMRDRRKPRPPQETLLGVAWYRPDQWARLLEISVDRDALEPTHAEWLRGAEKTLRSLHHLGVAAKVVDVDVEDLLAWCQERQWTVDGKARAQYVADKLRRQYSASPEDRQN